MSGINMILDEVDMQATSVDNVCKEYTDKMTTFKQKVNQFVGDDTLQGKAYASAKMFYKSAYIPLANGIIMLAQKTAQAHKKFPAQYRAQVCGNSLRSEELKKKITELKSSIKQTNEYVIGIKEPSLRLAAEKSYASNLSNKERLIKELEEKLDKLLKFNTVSSSIFAGLSELQTNVRQGLNLVNNNKIWNAKTGTFHVGKLDMTWSHKINKQWKQYEKDQAAKEAIEKVEKDYKKGLISKETMESLKTGILHAGANFLQEVINGKVTDKVASAVANQMIDWVRRNTAHFMNRGLVAQTTANTNVVISNASKLSHAIRNGAKYIAPVAAFAIDVGIQKAQGAETGDAVTKAAAHTAISAGAQAAGTAIGATLGSAIPILGTAGGAVVGRIIGAGIGIAGNMLFDKIYDNRHKISGAISKMGSAVKNFFSGGNKKTAYG